MQDEQKCMLNSARPLIEAIQMNKVSRKNKTPIDSKLLLDCLWNSLTCFGNVSYQASMRRREFLKPEVSKNFRSLSSSSLPLTNYLFGDDISKQADEITKANEITSKVVTKKSNSGNRSNRRKPGSRNDNRFPCGFFFTGSFRLVPPRSVPPRELEIINHDQVPPGIEGQKLITVSSVGQIATHFDNWYQISRAPWVLQCVQGYRLEFEMAPHQVSWPTAPNFTAAQALAIDHEVSKLLEKGGFTQTHHTQGEFLSNFPFSPKENRRHETSYQFKDLKSPRLQKQV